MKAFLTFVAMQPLVSGVDMTVWSGVAHICTVRFSAVLCCDVLYCPSFIQHCRRQFPIPLCLMLSSVSRMMCLAVQMQNIKVSLTKSCIYSFDKMYMHCWDTRVWKCLPPLHSYQPCVSCLFVIQSARLHISKHHLFTLSSSRYASGCALGRFPSLADPEWFQFPWLHPEPVHQQRAPGLHQDPDETRRGAGLRALQEDLLRTWHLPAWWGPGTSVPLPARLERAALWPAYYQPLPGQQVCQQMG